MSHDILARFAIHVGAAAHVRVFRQQGAAWQTVLLKGERRLPATGGWPGILGEIDGEMHRQDKLARAELHFVYEQAAAAQVAEAMGALPAFGCSTWQVLRAEPLMQRAGGLTGADMDDEQVWHERLLPLLERAFFYGSITPAAKSPADKDAQHELALQDLRAEIARLSHEKEGLELRLGALRQADMNSLLSFLPVLYRNFWSGCSPADLALRAGLLETPAVASPYQEPGIDTIAAKRRQLASLKPAQREELRSFCRQHFGHLEVRYEMRDFFQEDAA
jgi:hypothetical protein